MYTPYSALEASGNGCQDQFLLVTSMPFYPPLGDLLVLLIPILDNWDITIPKLNTTVAQLNYFYSCGSHRTHDNMDSSAEVPPLSHHSPLPQVWNTSSHTTTGTDESELSVDDSGPSTPAQDSDSLGDDGVRIIRPYAVEEPEDEPDTPRRNLLRLPDRFERWQRDLSEYMNDLNYEADGQHGTSTVPRKQGQKRKLAHAPRHEGGYHGRASSDMQQGQEQRSKKRRSDSLEDSPVTNSFQAFRDVNVDESSCSDARSTECSGIDTTANSPDEMDID
ncbi:unnamed protein product [Penicillium salamii]|uniref:Uncharacterized protein n=1 Tax=Penicillium salamii TaxID=1612424 RepID=A0A9W4N5J1_9EURO|nr:unnamed protein product [Penicillium salamii]CAG8234553.1 unnamed protein product [Penicillium salamii]CAG8255623.1 unnamed protein product [Penicillium salamii]CAG8260855.1 unnamed protein product [Penicillium salamii]CAG8348353.1 unnamed protein product [Penicillium salamii]